MIADTFGSVVLVAAVVGATFSSIILLFSARRSVYERTAALSDADSISYRMVGGHRGALWSRLPIFRLGVGPAHLVISGPLVKSVALGRGDVTVVLLERAISGGLTMSIVISGSHRRPITLSPSDSVISLLQQYGWPLQGPI